MKHNAFVGSAIRIGVIVVLVVLVGVLLRHQSARYNFDLCEARVDLANTKMFYLPGSEFRTSLPEIEATEVAFLCGLDPKGMTDR